MGLVQGLPPHATIALLVGWAEILVFHQVWSAKIQEYPKHNFSCASISLGSTVVRHQTTTTPHII